MPTAPVDTDTVLVDRTTVLGGVDLVRARFIVRATPVHSHAETEVGVVTNGCRLVNCRGRIHHARAGSVVVFAPGEIHAGAPADTCGSSYRAFLIPEETLAATAGWPAEGGLSPWFEQPVVNDVPLARLLLDAHVAVTAGAPDGESKLGSALAALVRGHACRRAAIGPREHAAVSRVRSYLEHNYGNRVRLGTLADLAGLSVFHLIRIFRAATGLPPYSYLEQVRVNRATDLLRAGYPVSRVAMLTGFADQSHLTRFFKRLVGVPPGQYRRSVLAGRRARGTDIHFPRQA